LLVAHHELDRVILGVVPDRAEVIVAATADLSDHSKADLRKPAQALSVAVDVEDTFVILNKLVFARS